MTVFLYEPYGRKNTTNPKQIMSACQNFGEIFKIITSLEELPNEEIVVCVDKQAKQMLGYQGIETQDLTSFYHESKNYLFGPNTGVNMAHVVEGFPREFTFVSINSPANQVFWVEQAIAIILYDRFISEM